MLVVLMCKSHSCRPCKMFTRKYMSIVSTTVALHWVWWATWRYGGLIIMAHPDIVQPGLTACSNHPASRFSCRDDNILAITHPLKFTAVLFAVSATQNGSVNSSSAQTSAAAAHCCMLVLAALPASPDNVTYTFPRPAGTALPRGCVLRAVRR
jgi:hypothetical protein